MDHTLRTGVQVYPLRNLDRTGPDLIQIIADTSVDGVEFYEFTVSATDSGQAAVKAALGATGLDAVGPMFPYGVPLNAMVANLDASVNVYAPLGCERNVVPRFNAIPLTR